MVKVVPEGLPFVILLFMLFFFRDPERNNPKFADAIVSPADGKIIKIENMYKHEYLKKDVVKISIFMSPFNVYVNRAPYSGSVLAVAHNAGGFFAAY
jgi:phosphatidylserine decarboxylase